MSMILGSNHDLPCPFKLLFSSLLLPTFFYLPVTLLYFISMHFISFHFPFMRVTSMSFHYRFISFHCPYMSCPKSSQIEYSECMTLVTMVVPLYMCEYWGEKSKYIHIQKHFLSCSCHFPFIFVHIPFMCFYFPVSFLSLPSMFLPFSSIISLFYVHLI